MSAALCDDLVSFRTVRREIKSLLTYFLTYLLTYLLTYYLLVFFNRHCTTMNLVKEKKDFGPREMAIQAHQAFRHLLQVQLAAVL